EAFDIIQRYLARLFPTETGALYLLTPTRAELEQVAAWGERAAGLAPAFALEDCWAIRRGHLHHARMTRGDAACRHMSAADVREHICVPMLVQGEALGILCLSHSGDTDTRMGEESFVSLVQTLANSIGLSVANLRLRDELRRLSIRDTLTGLFNRRYLDETLRREILRAKRAKSTLGVIMLDIDHFKRVNDTYGHEAGDAILSTLGGFLERHVRGEDVACRYGGEEFTLILPGTSLEIARDRAEQLRVGVQALVVRVADRPLEAVTLSLGVAVMPDHGETAETILQAADAALYRAKQGGRDRVEVARSLIVSLPGSRHSEETPHHSRL
ncbi:MAG TPA: sensor domain-containing diguanylate cyclase, partial [Patescibacteria group bacterium]|nr:sensor domain-containing diguanylate cyclase [Patescibacteria group bacterium]